MGRMGMTTILGVCALMVLVAYVFTSLFATNPALAGEPELRRVTVAADDTLNVRAEPNGSAEILGELADGEVIEVTALSENGKWGRIPSTEVNGWLALRFTETIDDRPRVDGMATALSCHGTEPFWTAEISEKGAYSYKSFNDGAGPSAMISRVERYGEGHRFTAGRTIGDLTGRECSNGMTDTLYGWQLDLYFDGDLSKFSVSGCCEVATGE